MSEHTANLNRFWAELVVEELIRNDVRTFCLASGSRCSPLTIAVARHPSARSVIHPDERGLGFFAVGHARATGRPVAVITTSGTAAANLLPSVIESSQARLPMIILSADRPPELRDTDANQTMRQSGLFGSYIRSEVDMPCPAEEIAPGYVLSTIDHAVHASLHPSPGPVHLNLMFREPLVPASPGKPPSPAVGDVSPWFRSAGPYTRCNMPVSTSPEKDVERIADLLRRANRGLILAGELRSPAARDRVLNLAHHLNWPIVNDVLSGLRCTGDPLAMGAGVFPVAAELLKDVDTVVHVGGRFVSGEPVRYLAENRPAVYVHVTPYASRSDPGYLVTHRLEGAPDVSLDCLLSRAPQSTSSEWANEVSKTWSRIQACFDEEENREEISEPMAARAVTRGLPEGHGLFLGNSMPVRDVDQFAVSRKDQPEFAANRGVSGIDGSISSGFGFAAGLDAPVTLLFGDLSCLHDLNGLKFAAEATHPVTVVAVNNNGGGIFHFLPVISHSDVFESHYGTPHGLRLEDAAKMFGLGYATPSSMPELRRMYQKAVASGESRLLEVFTSREENAKYHQELERKIEQSRP